MDGEKRRRGHFGHTKRQTRIDARVEPLVEAPIVSPPMCSSLSILVTYQVHASERTDRAAPQLPEIGDYVIITGALSPKHRSR